MKTITLFEHGDPVYFLRYERLWYGTIEGIEREFFPNPDFPHVNNVRRHYNVRVMSEVIAVPEQEVYALPEGIVTALRESNYATQTP